MRPGKISVSVRNKSRLVRLSANRVKALARFVLRAEKTAVPQAGATVNILFCDDAFITDMNKQYFGKDRPTDVISFPGSPEPAPEGHDGVLHVGDVLISLETAQSQHKVWKTTFEEETALYVIHGILHLLGYTDTAPEDYRRMQDRQNAILLSLMQSARDRTILDLRA